MLSRVVNSGVSAGCKGIYRGLIIIFDENRQEDDVI